MNPSRADRLRDRHRSWLARLGILDRPWLILGSAPRPMLPAELVAGSARVDINNAGRTAAALGLGRADLTVRTHRKSWKEHPKLDTRGLLWAHSWPYPAMLWQLWRQKEASVDTLRRWTREEREAIVDIVAGAEVGKVGDLGKATTGIAAACYGLFVGVPRVVLAGISPSAAGHSYDDRQRPRKQVDEDKFVLGHIAGRPELWTTEEHLAEATGLRLWPATP